MDDNRSVEEAAKGWNFRVVLSVNLAGAGPRFKEYSEGLGAKGGEAFQNQMRGFIGAALDGAQTGEGVWLWTGDGALLAFADASRAHEFALALHRTTATHNRAATALETQRRFRVGMAATDDPERESWDYTVMRAARLESKADVDGILIDVETCTGLRSTLRSLYGPVEQVPGKRDDEFYAAHRYPAAPAARETEPETGNARLHNLPPDVPHFKGRGAEESALLEALRRAGGTQAITALKGIGGIGKSALAVRVARQLVLQYPAAQILVNLRGTEADPLSRQAAMADVIRRFEPNAQLPDDDTHIAEIYRDLLTQHKSLLILDNARDSAQVQPLLPPAPSAAIVTSRQRVAGPGIGQYSLDNLARAEAVALLAELIAPFGTGDLPVPARLDQLAAACVDHPLALTIVATNLSGRAEEFNLDAYIAEIASHRERLAIDGEDGSSVMAALAVSLDQLIQRDADLAERWRDLAVFPADFDAPAAAAVWDATDTTSDLRRLSSLGFLEAGSASERFRLHDLMRDLARLDPGEDRFAKAEVRHRGHYRAVLAAANDLYLEGGAQNTRDGLALYDREQANILTGQASAVAAMRQAASAAAGDLVYRYADAGAYVLRLRLHSREWILWWQGAAEGARLSENRLGEGNALGNLGIAHAALGETAKAIDYHEQSLVISREMGDRRGEGNSLGNLGNAHADLGETAKAIDYHEQYLVISREIGDRRGEGNALGSLGNAHAVLGETAKAIDYYEQSLVISREIGDRRGEGNALGSLGNAYAGLGETAKAIDYYEQRLVIAREIGDRRGEGNALGNLGVTYEILKRFTEARQVWTSALSLYEAIGHPDAEKVRGWLAELDG